MNGSNEMRKIILSVALVVLTGGPEAFAQGSSVPKNSDRPLPQAPVGHRQPRASDVPSEKNLNDPNDTVSKENAILDRKIKSICRGC
jgi:hypothetical protein